MAECVDTSPEVHQPPALSPSPDALDTDASVEQLLSRNYSMLCLGKSADETDGMFVFHGNT